MSANPQVSASLPGPQKYKVYLINLNGEWVSSILNQYLGYLYVQQFSGLQNCERLKKQILSFESRFASGSQNADDESTSNEGTRVRFILSDSAFEQKPSFEMQIYFLYLFSKGMEIQRAATLCKEIDPPALKNMLVWLLLQLRADTQGQK